MFHQLVDLVLPNRCVLCDQVLRPGTKELICTFCRAMLPNNLSSCRGCGLPHPQPTSHLRCNRCRRTYPFNPADLVLSPLRHEGAGRYLVHRLKFQQNLRAGKALAQVMLAQIRQVYAGQTMPRIICPVPLSRLNQIRRPTNQAAYLATHLSRALGIPLGLQHLQRRHGPAQRNLPRSARLRLSSSTFSVNKPLAHNHIGVVDDVITTGRTAQVIKEQLYAAGAKRVDFWSATRAVD